MPIWPFLLNVVWNLRLPQVSDFAREFDNRFNCLLIDTVSTNVIFANLAFEILNAYFRYQPVLVVNRVMWDTTDPRGIKYVTQLLGLLQDFWLLLNIQIEHRRFGWFEDFRYLQFPVGKISGKVVLKVSADFDFLSSDRMAQGWFDGIERLLLSGGIYWVAELRWQYRFFLLRLWQQYPQLVEPLNLQQSSVCNSMILEKRRSALRLE